MCCVLLSKNINPSLVLVQPWKTRSYKTERLLMGRKEDKSIKQVFKCVSIFLYSSLYGTFVMLVILQFPVSYNTGLDKQNFECKIVNIFLPISLNICFGCSKEPSHWDSSFD